MPWVDAAEVKTDGGWYPGMPCQSVIATPKADEDPSAQLTCFLNCWAVTTCHPCGHDVIILPVPNTLLPLHCIMDGMLCRPLLSCLAQTNRAEEMKQVLESWRRRVLALMMTYAR